MTPIRSILIANRGEIALRIIRTCRELGVRSIAVYSDADRASRYVRAADEALHLGPSPPASSYLNGQAIIDCALKANADAIHPGYGFLSESAMFAGMVRAAGLTFVGPTPETIALLGDKTEARRLMKQQGIPVLPGTDGTFSTSEEAARAAATFGFPVILKAAAGGGGRGMRVVRDAGSFEQAFQAASSEASSAFGDGRIFFERYFEQSRHVEFQIMGDSMGNVVHLGERECSIQRRHQKILEESPSPALTAGLRDAMGICALRAARCTRYCGAGTVEFLLDESGNFYFLEVNTRLQVEHPVTELRTGLDLVAMQITIAQGQPLPFDQSQIQWRGHAIECRICAEDIDRQFAPAAGRITHWRPSQGPGIREDSGVEEESEISVFYDSLLSKLCVWAPTRGEAIQRMKRALEEYEIMGVPTNLALLRRIVEDPIFQSGTYSTTFLTQRASALVQGDDRTAEEEAAAIVCALLEDASKHPANGTRPQREVQTGTNPPQSRWKNRGSWK